MIDRANGNRNYDQSTLALVKPKITPPKEVRLIIKSDLLECSEEEFIKKLKEWNIIPYSYGHLDHQEMIELFNRVDTCLLSTLTSLKNLKKTQKNISQKSMELEVDNSNQILENRIEDILRGITNILDIVKGVKYSNLFKSIDLMADVLLCSEKVENIALAVDVITISRTIIRKKNLLLKYLGPKIDDIAWCTLVLSKLFKIFTVEEFFDPDVQRDEMFDESKFSLIEGLKDFYLNKEKNSKFHGITIKKLLQSGKKFEKDDYIFRILRLLYNNWSDFYARLDIYSSFLKSISLVNLLKQESFVKNKLRDLKEYNTNISFSFEWPMVKKLLSTQANPDFHCTVIRTKWSQINDEDYIQENLVKIKEILQILLVNLNKGHIKKTNLSLPIQRKSSAHELEKMIEEKDYLKETKRKLVTPKSQILIEEIINAIKACFLYEDRHIQGGIQNDYSKILELVSTLLTNSSLNKITLNYSPTLINSILELLRVDIGADNTSINKILDFSQELIVSLKTHFLNENNQLREFDDLKYNELIIEMMEVIDSLFVEPNKSFYIVNISQYAREVAEHSIWKTISKIKKPMTPILDSIVVLLDDILTEMPENLVNPTLQKLVEYGVADMLIDHFLSLKKLDFETIGFYILFMCKYILSPVKPKNFDENLIKAVSLAFERLIDRNFVKQNIMRFSGADSTNALIVLVDEVIDLVNVKYSLKEKICECMDGALKRIEKFYEEFWVNLPYILKRDFDNLKLGSQHLRAHNWSFEGKIEDEFYFIDKLNQNLIKFFCKFYDIHRTNLHDEFKSIKYGTRILKIFRNQPNFDNYNPRQRKSIGTSLARVLNPAGNVLHRKGILVSCLSNLMELLDENLEIGAKSIWGTELEKMVPLFLFKDPNSVAAKKIFSERLSSDEILSLLRYVNNYNSIVSFFELVRGVMDFTNGQYEVEEDLALHGIYPKYIKMEQALINSKVHWFTKNLKNWRIDLCKDKTEITFDTFSNYSFGAIDMFTYETASKPIEKIMKSINSSNKPKKWKILSPYAIACGKILGDFKFTDKSKLENYSTLVKEVFMITKTVQSFAYMISTFEGVIMLNSLFESGVLDFCQKAIIFGLDLIMRYKEEIMKLKSIRESKDKVTQKVENSVKVSAELNDMKYILETICPKLVFCWNIVISYFHLQKLENYTSSFENILNKNIFNKARVKAIDVLVNIFNHVNPELNDILDMDLIHSEKEVEKEMEKGNDSEKIKVVLKNVNNGYNTLKHIHNFLRYTIFKSLDLIPHIHNIYSKIDIPKEKPKEEEEDEIQEEGMVEEHPPSTPENSEMQEEENNDIPEEPTVLRPPVTLSANNLLHRDNQVSAEKKLREMREFNKKLQNNPEIAKRGFTEEEFQKELKERIRKLWDEITKKSPTFGNLNNKFGNYLVEGMTKFDFFNPRKLILKQSLVSSQILQNIKSEIIIKTEKKPNSKRKKSMKTLGVQLFNDFDSNSVTRLNTIKVFSKMLRTCIRLDQEKNFGINWFKEYNLISWFLLDLLKTIPKLISKVGDDKEKWQKYYNFLLISLVSLMKTYIICNKSLDKYLKSGIQNSKKNVKKEGKKSAGNKKRDNHNQQLNTVEEMRKRLVEAFYKYTTNQGAYLEKGVSNINSFFLGVLLEFWSWIFKDNPEILKSFCEKERLKLILNLKVSNSDNHQMESKGIKSFFSFIEILLRNDALLEKTIEQEIRYFFHFKGENFKNSNQKENIIQEIETALNFKKVTLKNFENKFKPISNGNKELFLSIVKRVCVLHKEKNETFITLRDQRQFVTDFQDIPNRVTKIVTRLIKEIIRSINFSFSKISSKNSEEENIENIIPLSVLINSFGVIIARRYPILLKFILKFNISKIIKSLKNTEWLMKRLGHDCNINFIQFFVRILLYLDPTNFMGILTDFVDNSAVLVNSIKDGVYCLSSDIRALVISEIKKGLEENKESFIKILNEKKEKLGVDANSEDVQILRNLTSYTSSLMFLCSFVEGLKTPWNEKGEMNIQAIVKFYSEIYERIEQDSFAGNFEMSKIIESALKFFMKLNYLLHADKEIFMKFDRHFNIKNPDEKKNTHVILLQDFASFRTSFPYETSDFKKTRLILLERKMNVEFEKNNNISEWQDPNLHPGDNVVEIRIENVQNDPIFEEMQNLPESENISVGNNRLILVQQNHNLMDPIEGDPILSEQDSALSMRDLDSENISSNASSGSFSSTSSVDSLSDNDEFDNINFDNYLNNMRMERNLTSDDDILESDMSYESSADSGESFNAKGKHYNSFKDGLGSDDKKDECFEQLMNVYPYRGKVDTVGALNVILSDDQGNDYMQHINNVFDNFLIAKKGDEFGEVFKKISMENTRVCNLVSSHIFFIGKSGENLAPGVRASNISDRRGSGIISITNRGFNFGNQFERTTRFNNSNNVTLNEQNLGQISVNFNDLSIFELLRGDQGRLNFGQREERREQQQNNDNRDEDTQSDENEEEEERASAEGRLGQGDENNLENLFRSDSAIEHTRMVIEENERQERSILELLNKEMEIINHDQKEDGDVSGSESNQAEDKSLLFSFDPVPVDNLFGGIFKNDDKFNFEKYGLSEKFLEENGIDETFFEFLSLKNKLNTIKNCLHGEDQKKFKKKLTQIQKKGNNGILGFLNLESPEFETHINSLLNEEEPESGEPEEAQATENIEEEEEEEEDQVNNNNNQETELNEENVAFLQTLTADLRQEILLTCPDDFLQSLTPEIQEEAARLRRIGFFDDFVDGLNQHILIDQIDEGNEEDEDEDEEENSQSRFGSAKKSNKKMELTALAKPNILSDKSIQKMISTLYANTDLDELKTRIFSISCSNSFNQFKIFDALFFILENPNLPSKYYNELQFPPDFVNEYPSKIKNSSVVYKIISTKILRLMTGIIHDHNAFFDKKSTDEGIVNRHLETIQELRKRLGMLTKTIDPAILRLINLLKIDEINHNSEALEYLLSVLKQILQKQSKEEIVQDFQLKDEHIRLICSVLSSEKLNSVHLGILPGIISILCTNKHNLDTFITEIKITLQNLIQNVSKGMKYNLEMLNEAKKREMVDDEQFLKMFLYNSIKEDSKSEKRLLKVFKMIGQLFVRYFETEDGKKVKESAPKLEGGMVIEMERNDSGRNQEQPGEASEEFNFDEKTKIKVRKKFSQILEDRKLVDFWVDLMKIMDLIGNSEQERMKNLEDLVNRLKPLTECFFIAFKILSDDEHLKEIRVKSRKTKMKSAKKSSKKISKFEEDVEEMMEKEEEKTSYTELEALKIDEFDMAKMFQVMCDLNKNFLNHLIEGDVRLLNDSFSCITKHMTKIISFKNKRAYFTKALKKEGKKEVPLRLNIRRNEIFMDSYNQFMNRDPQQLKGKLQIKFAGEDGDDAGGVTREWFLSLSKEIFNPDYALFKHSDSQVTYQPNPHSHVNPDHCKFFKFIGRIIGKALYNGYLLDAYFTRSFYKHMTGDDIVYHDYEDIDPQYYKNLKWILHNNVTGMGLNFCYQEENFGEIIEKELIPGGKTIEVTEENKREYVNKLCYAKMATDIKQQIESFLEGLHDLIPQELVSIFDNQELELMISGLPEINIDDLRENTIYVNYVKKSQVIVWFWEVVEEWDSDMRANFLQFVTGTSKVPIEGFKSLRGIGGQVQKFQIHKVYDVNLLPTAHTCLNQLELPEYKRKDVLKKNLEIALELGKEGFGFE